MKISLLPLFALPILLLIFLVIPSIAFAQQAATVRLDSMNGSTISGTATLTANADATDAIVDLKGFAPGTAGIVNVYSNTCAQPSASFALISQFTADTSGNVHVAAPVLFHGTNVALADISTLNIVGVYSNGTLVACGVIPQSASSQTLPTTGGTFDANSYAILGIAGFVTLMTGFVLSTRSLHSSAWQTLRNAR